MTSKTFVATIVSRWAVTAMITFIGPLVRRTKSGTSEGRERSIQTRSQRDLLAEGASEPATSEFDDRMPISAAEWLRFEAALREVSWK